MFNISLDYSKQFLATALLLSAAFVWIIKATGCARKVQSKGKGILQVAPQEKSSRVLFAALYRPGLDQPETVTLVARRLFYDITGDLGEGLGLFSFKIQEEQESKLDAENSAPLTMSVYIKDKKFTIPLSAMFAAIDWRNLEKRWERVSDKQWEKFTNSFFRRFCYAEQNDNPTLQDYCRKLDEAINPLLFQNQIAFKKIGIRHRRLDIDFFAKSIFFSALCLAGRLQQLPSTPSDTLVKRHVTLSKSSQERYQIGALITETYFFHTSQDEYSCKVGEGNTLFQILTKVNSSGKAMASSSKYPAEKYVIFLPYTRFEVIDRKSMGNQLQVFMKEV